MQLLTDYGITRESVLFHAPRVRRIILKVLVIGIPVLFLRSLNDPFNVAKLALLLAGTACVLAIRAIELLQGGDPSGLRRLLIPAALVVGPLTVAWIFGPYRIWSLFGYYGRFQGLIPYLVVIVLGVLIADAFAGRLRELAWALTIAGAVAGAYSFVQFLGLDPFSWSTTQTSTLGNSNFTGGFLSMVLPVSVGLWLEERADSTRIWKLIVLIALGELVSVSDGGYAASVAGLAVVAGFHFRDRFRWSKVAAAATVAAIALAVVGVVAAAMIKPGMESIPLTIRERSLWWRGAVNMTVDNPIVGRGPNSYAVEGVQYRPTDDALTHGFDFSDDTHSVLLAFLTGAGILGLAGLVAAGVRVVSRARSFADQDFLLVGMLGAMAAYLIQSLVSIDELSLRVTFWVLLGGLATAGIAAERDPEETKQQKRKSARAPKRKAKATSHPLQGLPMVGVAVVAALVAVWWSGGFLIADARVSSGTNHFRRGEVPAALSEYDRALGFRNDYRYAHLYGFFLGQTALGVTPLPNRDLIEMARDVFAFVDGFPSVPALTDYGRLLSAASDDFPIYGDEATDVYLRAMELDEYNLVLVAEGVTTFINTGHEEEAIAFLEPRMAEYETVNPELWHQIALAYAQLGKEEKARAALEQGPPVPPGVPLEGQLIELLGNL